MWFISDMVQNLTLLEHSMDIYLIYKYYTFTVEYSKLFSREKIIPQATGKRNKLCHEPQANGILFS